ncbi:uncharacterized protein LOC134538927 isoform X2 [Bacillus rossius redtenbacheri]|uniref:uncharacterized protein LOC134538927 isoform X2 n=1 Tax=Bacillus rossius redtenbacheri TaxID=93214 RepID=UPI002FDDBFAF
MAESGEHEGDSRCLSEQSLRVLQLFRRGQTASATTSRCDASTASLRARRCEQRAARLAREVAELGRKLSLERHELAQAQSCNEEARRCCEAERACLQDQERRVLARLEAARKDLQDLQRQRAELRQLTGAA